MYNIHRGNCPRRMARDRLGEHYSCSHPIIALRLGGGIYIYIEHVVLYIVNSKHATKDRPRNICIYIRIVWLERKTIFYDVCIS